MKMFFTSRLCALFIAAFAVLNLGAADYALAESATGKSDVPAIETPAPQDAPAVQGLMPPVASDSSSAVAAEPVKAAPTTTESVPKATVKYGSPKPDGEDTHPALTLTPDRAELIRLDTDAATIIVGSPDNVNIHLENRRLLVMTPITPGATYMSILDDNGNIIMQRHVIVSSPKTNYIRVRRSCSGQKGCESTSVYYCPGGMCHPVGTASGMPSGGSSAGSSISAGALGDASTPDSAPAPTVNPDTAPTTETPQ